MFILNTYYYYSNFQLKCIPCSRTQCPFSVDESVTPDKVYCLQRLAGPELLALHEPPVHLEYVDADRPGRQPQDDRAPLGRRGCPVRLLGTTVEGNLNDFVVH